MKTDIFQSCGHCWVSLQVNNKYTNTRKSEGEVYLRSQSGSCLKNKDGFLSTTFICWKIHLFIYYLVSANCLVGSSGGSHGTMTDNGEKSERKQKQPPPNTHTQFFPSWTLLSMEDYYNNLFSTFHSISQIGHLLKMLIFVPSMMTILCFAEIPLMAIKHNINYR